MEELEPDTEPLGVLRRTVPTRWRTGEQHTAPPERLAALIRRQEMVEAGDPEEPPASPLWSDDAGGFGQWEQPGEQDTFGATEAAAGVHVSRSRLPPPTATNSEGTASQDRQIHRRLQTGLGERSIGRSARQGTPGRRVAPRRAVLGALILALLLVLVLLLFFPRNGTGSGASAGVLPPDPARASGPAGGGQTDAGGEPSDGQAASGASTQNTSPQAASRQGGSSGPVLVHVVGAVQHPGIRRLPAGSVVDDAVRAAGGFTPQAAPEAVNLAAPVQGGQQLVVPTREQVTEGHVPAPAGSGTPGSSSDGSAEATSSDAGSGAGPGDGSKASAGTDADAQAPATGQAVDLNTASATDLEALPRVGPVLAQRIVDYRAQHGKFASVDALDEVPGIGPAMMASLRPLVRT